MNGFNFDSATGKITGQLAGNPFGTTDTTGAGGAIVVDRSNNFVFVSEDCGDVHSFKRNLTDGSLSGEVITPTAHGDACSLAVTY